MAMQLKLALAIAAVLLIKTISGEPAVAEDPKSEANTKNNSTAVAASNNTAPVSTTPSKQQEPITNPRQDTTIISSNKNVAGNTHEGRENVKEQNSNAEERIIQGSTNQKMTLPPIILAKPTATSRIHGRKGVTYNSAEASTVKPNETRSDVVANNTNINVSNNSNSANIAAKTTAKPVVVTSDTGKTNASAQSVSKANSTNSTVSTANSNVTTASSTVSVPKSTSTAQSTTTTTVRPKKPTVTIGSEDEPEAKITSEKAEKTRLNSHETNTNFVVPIVAVILAVPLVAIVASVLYKRGTEWWQHRHYRRMDFLIDGMYNN